jgi:hypothetical protein
MTNPIRLGVIPAGERIAEIGALLALGLIRLMARQSSELSAKAGESSLDCVADQSGHFEPKRREK